MEDPCKRSLIGIEAMRTLLLAFCTILGQLAPEQLCVPGQLIARRAFTSNGGSSCPIRGCAVRWR